MESRHLVKTVVVDDNPTTLYSTGRVLESASYQVIRCMRGAEALASIDATTGAVILDINLPDIDGIEICRHLRAQPDTRQLPIIHLSASKIRDSDRVEGLDAGADAYLTHPVHPQVLLATVRTLLRARDAEAALRSSEANLRNIFDQAPCGIATLDRELRFSTVNAQMLLLMHRDPDQLLGRGIFDFSLPDQQAVRASLLALLGNGLRWTDTIRLQTPYAGLVDLEWNITPRHDADELLCIVTDVTQRSRKEAEREQQFDLEREAREEAERIGRIKDEFLATLSHELRNPLAPLKNALYLLQMSDPSSASANKAREVMARQVDHMTRLVDDLVDVSRITRGLVQLEVRRASMRGIVDAAIEASLPQIQAAGHRLEVNIDAGDVELVVDPVRLTQVFTNIMNNAAKYTPRGGLIQVSMRVFSHHVDVAIADSGIGIPEHMIERIFDVFTQINPTGPQAAGGLGIGLTLAKRLVVMHGGQIAVSSDGLDQGSRFTVSLPLARQVAAGSTTDRDVASDPLDTLGRRAIVIDDNRDSAESLCALLIALGHECEAFFDGSTGVAAIQTRLPDFAFIDIGMPEIDGHEVAQQLKSSPATRHIPLFALTGWDQEEERVRSQASGFAQHLAKPISLADLKAVLRSPVAVRSA